MSVTQLECSACMTTDWIPPQYRVLRFGDPTQALSLEAQVSWRSDPSEEQQDSIKPRRLYSTLRVCYRKLVTMSFSVASRVAFKVLHAHA